MFWEKMKRKDKEEDEINRVPKVKKLKCKTKRLTRSDKTFPAEKAHIFNRISRFGRLETFFVVLNG